MKRSYWRTEGTTKTFYCPFDLKLFRANIPLDSEILDYGTGYGRILNLLIDAGYHNLLGVDASPEMIELAKTNLPDIPLKVVDANEVPFEDETFDAIILYSVMSSILSSHERAQLVQDLRTILKPGGTLYINDFLVQHAIGDEERYREGYALGLAEYNDTVFVDPGASYAFYHFTPESVVHLSEGFTTISQTAEPARSMNGAERNAFQLLLRKSS